MSTFGRVHYSDESGETLVVHCESKASFDSAVRIADGWVEDSSADRSVWGEVLGVAV